MVFATLCLSSSSLLAKYVYREGVGPVTMLDLRFVVAAAVLWLFYLSARNWRQYIWLKSRRQFWGCVAVGGANALSQSLYFVALQELDPGLAQMIFSFNPAIIALIMLFFGERLTRLKIARLGLGLGGLYFLTLAGGNAGQSVPAFSVLLIMFCSVVYAVHMVLYQKLLPGTSSRTNTLYILTTMAVIYSVIELFQRGVSGVAGVDATAWIFILVMALVSTSVARLLMFGGLALIGGTQAALIGIGEPVIVLFSSVWLLGERLTLNQWLGAGLIICSIALAAIRIDGRRNRQARLGQP
jgi:drug/metabolite transporter (DMT)-like permease